MAYDLITIGSATIDIFMKSAQFHLQPTQQGVLLCEEYGGKIDVEEFEMHSGGAGTNTAVGFARMNLRTGAVVQIGDDIFAQYIWDDLKREKVHTDFVLNVKNEHTAVSVILISEAGGRSAMVHRGASAHLDPRDLPWEELRQTRWIHVSNVAGNKELLLRLFDHLRASSVGVSWNPGSKELALLATRQLVVEHIVCDLFFVNKEEWQVVESVQKEILAHVPSVIVTDGKNGGDVFLKNDYHFHYDIDPVETKQETGAGDAFVVGYVSAHLLGLPPMTCCEWGKRNSASVVKRMGAKAGLLYRNEIERAEKETEKKIEKEVEK